MVGCGSGLGSGPLQSATVTSCFSSGRGAATPATSWEESDLEQHRKGAPQKLKIALRLRQQTTMTLAWVAQRLQMGTKTHLSHLLYWDERGKS